MKFPNLPFAVSSFHTSFLFSPNSFCRLFSKENTLFAFLCEKLSPAFGFNAFFSAQPLFSTVALH